MTMRELRVGVIGAGGIARSQHIPLLQKHPQVHLAAVADVSAEALAVVASKFNVPASYADYRELLDNEDLDAVVVCTPNKFHAPVAIAAMNKGLHVLCEKPMAASVEQAREMARVARETGMMLAIAYRYRFQPPVQAAKRLTVAQELGEIYMIRVAALRRRGIPSWGVFTNRELQGGGALIDFGVHLLDAALWLAGNPKAIEVVAVTSQRLGRSPGVNKWGAWNHEQFEVEDHAAAFVRLEGGKALQLEASWALNIAADQETISLSGTEGGLDVFPLRLNKAAHGMLLDSTPAWIPDAELSEWKAQIDDFVAAVLEGRSPLVQPEEALQVSEIVDAIYRSAAEGEVVRVG